MTAAGSELRLGGEPGRLRQLDGLRAIAIALVIAGHLWPLPTVGRWHPPVAYFGVSLFFVLSGFLITRVLLDARDRVSRPHVQLWPFFARRFLRIVPPYALTLIVFVALGVQQTQSRLLWHATYTSNWLLSHEAEWRRGGYDRHLWSLSVEEQFYLVWPLVILLSPRRLVVPLVALTFALGPASRAWALADGRAWTWTSFATPANADLLAAGALVACLSVPRAAAWAMAIVGLGASLALNGPIGNWQIGFRLVGNSTWLAVGCAGLVSLATAGFRGPAGKALGWRPVVYVGTISYGAYLVHTACAPLARFLIGENADSWLIASLATILTLAIASLSWHAFESPLLRLKGRVPYRREDGRPGPRAVEALR